MKDRERFLLNLAAIQENIDYIAEKSDKLTEQNLNEASNCICSAIRDLDNICESIKHPSRAMKNHILNQVELCAGVTITHILEEEGNNSLKLSGSNIYELNGFKVNLTAKVVGIPDIV